MCTLYALLCLTVFLSFDDWKCNIPHARLLVVWDGWSVVGRSSVCHNSLKFTQPSYLEKISKMTATKKLSLLIMRSFPLILGWFCQFCFVFCHFASFLARTTTATSCRLYSRYDSHMLLRSTCFSLRSTCTLKLASPRNVVVQNKLSPIFWMSKLSFGGRRESCQSSLCVCVCA